MLPQNPETLKLSGSLSELALTEGAATAVRASFLKSCYMKKFDAATIDDSAHLGFRSNP